MDEPICGAKTKKGPPCQYVWYRCPHHQLVDDAPDAGYEPTPIRPDTDPSWRLETARLRTVDAERPAALSRTRAGPPPEALAEHDIRALAWWLFEREAGPEEFKPDARVLVTILRLLETLGPDPMEMGVILAESVLRGKLSHGIPPSDEAEWELARERFSEEALAEFASWPRLRKTDCENVSEPFPLWDFRADDADEAFAVDDENGF